MRIVSAKIGIYELRIVGDEFNEYIPAEFHNRVTLHSKSIHIPFEEITGCPFNDEQFGETITIYDLESFNDVIGLQNYLLKLLLSKNIEVLLSVFIHVNSTEKVYLHSPIGDSNLRFSTEFKSHKIYNIEQWQFIESYSFDYTFKVESDESVKLLRGKTK